VNSYVGEILLRRGILEKEKLEESVQTADERGLSLVDVLVRKGEVEEETVVAALADEMGMELIPKIDPTSVPEHLIDEIPITFARQHHVVPISDDGEVVIIAVSNPLDPYVVDDVRALLGRHVEAKASTSEAIDDAINRVYERKDDSELEGRDDDEDDELQDLLDADDEAPIIRFVNNLFFTAVQDRASDIHIEPSDDNVVVRYRIDGKLHHRRSAPRGAHAAIIARIKIEAGLNIAEKRLPQDGRISKKIRGKVIDVRVSIIPTAKGESVVMRLLDKENIQLDLMDLGFAKRDLDAWAHLIERPDGILLITGPTGSGKTTTLYGSLHRINTPDKKILTAEDPVEYELKGINQLQTHSKIGLTFASALRAFLRQDPDVIMVGEIRDQETAELAIQASLTGHLVLSTLHTNDAPGAIPRLVKMGVQPFQISSTLLGVMAQRLVRKLCPHCKEPYTPSERILLELGLHRETLEQELKELQAVAKTTVLGRNSDPGIDLKAMGAMGERIEELSADDLLDAEPTMVRSLEDIRADQPPDVVRHLAERGVQVPDSLWKDPDTVSSLALVAQDLDQGLSVEMAQKQLDMLAIAGGGEPAGDTRRRSLSTPPEVTFYRPKGCDECNQLGYRGRLGIFEMLLINEPIRDAIIGGADSKTIAKVAMRHGMRSLRMDGARQVLAGVTSVEEVLAATQAVEQDLEAAE